MKKFLRILLLRHLQHPKNFWILAGAITLVLGLGVLRVERRLDLMSLLPTNHPIVKASIQAGVGQHELLWVVAEGTEGDLGVRRAWAESIVENLMDQSGMSLNGITIEGSISQPLPVPDYKGLSLWPPLLTIGSLMDGDREVMRLATEHLYILAPVLLGDGLSSIADRAQLRERLRTTAKALASPDPFRAKLAQLDPLGLRDLIPDNDVSTSMADQIMKGIDSLPLTIRTGYLETEDSHYLLLPLVLDFPNGETASTGRMLAWIGNGCVGTPPKKVSFDSVGTALSPTADRAFPVQVTGAHAIAYWESTRLGREIAMSLCLSFILIGIVYWVGFRTLAGYGFVVVPLVLGMFWALGLSGWILGRLNLMAAAFGAVLLGVGDDVGILIFSRYKDERAAGKSKALSLRATLLSTGPGVIAAMSATSLVFIACIVAPFPGFRDLGLTAGLGIMCCLISTFLLMPPMLLAFDKGRGVFATEKKGPLPMAGPSVYKAIITVAVIIFAAIGITRMEWEEDLRRFRQVGNPALELQENLGKVLGAGIQPLAMQMPLDNNFHDRWNDLVDMLGKENMPLPRFAPIDPLIASSLSHTWLHEALSLAKGEGLEPSALECPLYSLLFGVSDPLAVPLSLMGLLDSSQRYYDLSNPFLSPLLSTADNSHSTDREHLSLPQEINQQTFRLTSMEADSMFTFPIRLTEEAQDRLEPALEEAGLRLVGTRPLFRALKTVAKNSLQGVIFTAAAAILGIVAVFGRHWLFLLLALMPMAAGQIAVMGTLGWTGQPLTFLSLVAIPVALGVSVDTVFNLLNRARHEINAPAKVSRVNAVCAGTTLAGFGGLAFSSYKGLQGLGIAAIGGTALALLTTQWLLPWILEKWPLKKN